MTYVQLKNVFQGYIANEIELDNKRTIKSNNIEKIKCHKYNNTKINVDCQKYECNKQRFCKGRVLNCYNLDFGEIKVCLSIVFCLSF